MSDVIEEILISEKEFAETNYEKFKKSLVYIKSSLIDFNGNIYLTIDSLIKTNSIITASNNTTLSKVNTTWYRFNKIYIDKDLIDDKLYQIINK